MQILIYRRWKRVHEFEKSKLLQLDFEPNADNSTEAQTAKKKKKKRHKAIFIDEIRLRHRSSRVFSLLIFRFILLIAFLKKIHSYFGCAWVFAVAGLS